MAKNSSTNDLFVKKLSSMGEDKFYKFLITYSLNKLADVPKGRILDPAHELLEHYDMFLILYRKESLEVYMDLAKLFRKAAHKIYRIALKNEKSIKSGKFLHIV